MRDKCIDPVWGLLRSALHRPNAGRAAAVDRFYGNILGAWHAEAEARDQTEKLAIERNRELWANRMWEERKQFASAEVREAVKTLEQAIASEHRRAQFLDLVVQEYVVESESYCSFRKKKHEFDFDTKEREWEKVKRAVHRFSITLGDIKRGRLAPGKGNRAKPATDSSRMILMAYLVEQLGLPADSSNKVASDAFERFFPPSRSKVWPPTPGTFRRDWGSFKTPYKIDQLQGRSFVGATSGSRSLATVTRSGRYGSAVVVPTFRQEVRHADLRVCQHRRWRQRRARAAHGPWRG
jgi:hypothetical protein